MLDVGRVAGREGATCVEQPLTQAATASIVGRCWSRPRSSASPDRLTCIVVVSANVLQPNAQVWRGRRALVDMGERGRCPEDNTDGIRPRLPRMGLLDLGDHVT